MNDADQQAIKAVSQRIDHIVEALKIMREVHEMQQKQNDQFRQSLLSLREMVDTCFKLIISK